MTAPLRNGTESKFSTWLRSHPDIDSVHDSVNVTDQDFIFQKYRTNVDAMKTRDVQMAMLVELKTFNESPDDAVERQLGERLRRLLDNGGGAQ